MKEIKKLSPELRKKIIPGERNYTPDRKTPITNELVRTKKTL
ncbi:MAG: hypothetical protein WC875_05130 [Candidatus Absconditabacterales bacterium]|jgi:hypothetical protein